MSVKAVILLAACTVGNGQFAKCDDPQPQPTTTPTITVAPTHRTAPDPLAGYCPGKTIYIPPWAVPKRPHYTREGYTAIMMDPTLTPEQRSFIMKQMSDQNQPINVPFGNGYVIVAAHDPCDQFLVQNSQ